MKLYVIAGEASGDARGAELLRALRPLAPSLAIHGAGGHEMAALASAPFTDWAGEAVVGLWDVLKKYGYFKAQFDRMLGEVARLQPDALILIDYPGFNLRFAKAARAAHPRMKIIYYISPQVWAWNRGRIPKMARYLDLMLCIFPFEKPLYEASGLRTEFVGHPMLDSLAARRTGVARDAALVGQLNTTIQLPISPQVCRIPSYIWSCRTAPRPDCSLQCPSQSQLQVPPGRSR